MKVTSHEWAGYNMLGNQTFWQRLPRHIQEAVTRNTKRFVPEQRAFVQSLNAGARGVQTGSVG
jgi:TRAP-type C4-dicarboxylate transport system substrate-binding protein